MSQTETPTRPASRRISDVVTQWPGVTFDPVPQRRGECAFRLGRREIGHLHGDHAAHFNFPKDVWHELYAEGRVTYHPVFPGRVGPAARRIGSDDDVREVIELLRINYDRMITRHPELG
jgi:Family of unknown function (DUF5519)